MNIGARLDRLPAGRIHKRVFWAITLGLFFNSFCITMASSIVTAMAAVGFSDSAHNATFVSMTFFGMLIGALISGIIADKFGRKVCYVLYILLFACGSLGVGLAPDIQVAIVFRCISGIGLGADLVLGFPALGELLPSVVNAKWRGLASALANCGLAGSALLGFVLVPNFGWRSMCFLVFIAGVLIAILRGIWVPESPRWLVSQQRNDAALKVVEKIEASIEKEKNIKLEPVKEEASQASSAALKKTSFFSIFIPPVLGATLIAMLLMTAQSVANYTMTTWFPTMLKASGISLNNALGFTAITMIAGPCGCFFTTAIVGKFGRKPLIGTVFILTGIAGYIFGRQTSVTGFVIMGAIVVFLIFMLMPLCFGIYPPELFQTNVRMRALGFATAVSRVANILAPYAVVAYLSAGSVNTLMLILGILLAVTGLIVIFFAPETKNKKMQ